MEEHENCHVEPVNKPLDKEALASAEAAYLAVWGMGCPRCATRVRNGLLSLDGVLLADVFLDRGMAAAAYDPERVSPKDLVAAVAGAGNDGRHHYRAEIMTVMPASEALEE
jgi:copper chaperone CopZ